LHARLRQYIWLWSKVALVTSLFSTVCLAANPEVEKLEAVLKKDPENVQAHVRLGRIFLRETAYEKAIEHFKSAAAAESSPANLTSLADAYRKNKSFADEIRTLEVLEQKQPKDVVVKELLGRAYLSISNFDKSAERYRKAIEMDKKRLSAYDGLFNVFTKANNNYERRTLLSDMQKVFGETAEVTTKLCRFYSQDNFIEKGIEMCLKAINLDPNIPENHIFLALNYKASKEVEQSLKIIQTAAKRFTKSEFAQFTAGTMNDEIKNYESAAFHFRKCTQTDPQSDRCWAKLGMVALNLRQFQESLDAFQKACKLNSHAHYTSFRNATTTVRIWREAAWQDKFSNAAEMCGISTP
jgi:tetratricopeptide (TPR) repeat protein